MQWITGIQNAINYIEDHITEPIDYEVLGRVSFSSPFHFQRVFSILCGYTVGEYIRSRRLSLAGTELATGRERVIDVAAKYGYESPDAFAKAFQKFHGMSPSQARSNGAQLKAFSRLSIKITLEGGTFMNYRIEEKPAMILTGYKRHFDGIPDDRMEQEEDFYIHTRVKQYILDGLTDDPEDKYNVIMNIDEEGYDFFIASLVPEALRVRMNETCVLGAEYASWYEEIPIPTQLYAVFETERCAYPTLHHLDLRRKIVAGWLPASGYELADAPEIVVSHWYRGEKARERYMELWLPVRKR